MANKQAFQFDNDDSIEISYPAIWKRHWDVPSKQSALMTHWAAAWPQLYRVEDALLAFSQSNTHFKEWVAARFIAEGPRFSIDGKKAGRVGTTTNILMEKYYHPRHPAKLRVFSEYCDKHDLGALERLLRLPKAELGGQPPDLFVLPNRGRPFFVEVKGPGESLTKNQPRVFSQIRAAAPGIPILKARVREQRSDDSKWWSDC